MAQINKILISVDIEGVAGICSWDETELGSGTHAYFQEEMTKETISCCKALLDSGVQEIYVRDAHDSARNIIPSLLPKEVKLIRNWSGAPCDMMDGLDGSFDGTIFIGYHSPSRSDGNPLSHTMTPSLNHIMINKRIASEFTLNSYYAYLKKVPVILVAGDQNLCNLVKGENSLIETVTTNIGLHGAVIAKHPEVVQEEIYNQTIKALQTLATKKSAMFVPFPEIFKTEIHFHTHQRAFRASNYPGAYLLAPDKTGFDSFDFMEVLKFIMFNE